MIGPLQVGSAIGRLAVQLDRVASQRMQARGQRCEIQGLQHGIARLGMGKLETQHFINRHGVSGTPKSNARGGKAAQGLPGIRVQGASAR